ncbi:MAG TPA: bifunctional DNA-formamidopyrimidine glycosylase/DNA-(apurinic or apyrimidinic site) lyase [Oscillatoriaceae cyanobacterium]
MPELPEVETIRRDLESQVIGRRIQTVFLYAPEIVQRPAPGEFVTLLRGKTIERVDRRAKYLLIFLSDDWVWAIHLMLEGQLLYVRQDDPIKDETRLVVGLDDGHQLRLRDVVGFAKTQLVPADHYMQTLNLERLGPEPSSPEFDYATFRERLEGRSAMLKPLLLNQEIVAGLGNIYADEALFQAGLLPTRKVNTLGERELQRLYAAIVGVMREAIRDRGTSAVGGMYRDLWGRKGEHQAHLQVFRRAGKPCPGCGGKVEQVRVGGRATFVCPHCQR